MGQLRLAVAQHSSWWWMQRRAQAVVWWGRDVHNALVGYKKAISVFSVEDEMKAF